MASQQEKEFEEVITRLEKEISVLRENEAKQLVGCHIYMHVEILCEP